MTSPRLRRLSQNTLSALIGAAAFAVFTTGTAVAVATSAVSITDPSTGVRTHVTGKQSLATSERDPNTGAYARIDSSGRQLVATSSSAPKSVAYQLFDAVNDVASGYDQLQVPSTGTLVIHAISVAINVPQGQNIRSFITYIPRSNTTISVEVQIPLVPQGVFSGRDRIVATLDVDIYPAPGTVVEARFVRNATSDYADASWTLLGEML